MDLSEHEALAQRARRAYELGRLRVAARVALLLLPAIALGVSLSSARAECACLGALLLAGAVAVRWYGHGYDRAIVPGVVAGVFPMTAGLLQPTLRGAGDELSCAILCLVGLAAGVLLARYAVRSTPSSSGLRSISGFAMATGMTVLGCLGHGFEALLGLLLGAGVVATHALTRARADDAPA